VNIKTTIIVVGIAVVGIAGLRVYGAYRTERSRAIARAGQALAEASAKQKEAERVRENAEALSRSTRIVEPPTGPAFSVSPKEMFSLVDEQMELGYTAIDLRFYAEMESRYSTNRKLQTLAILHKAWLSLIGTTQSREEWVSFLTEHETRLDLSCAAHAGCKDGHGRPAREIDP
jgi:uncharacterized protein YcgI (DUF1989 family)